MKVSDIYESPIPDKWDSDMLSNKTSFAKTKKYVLDNAVKLGQGSSRLAVEVEYDGRPTAFKVAVNNKGIQQNIEEISILTDYFAVATEMIIPIIDYDESENPKWIHTEKAEKATESFFKKTFNASLSTLIMYAITKYEYIVGRRKIPPNDIFAENEKATEFCDTLIDLAHNTSLILSDLRNKSNWGIYKNKPVIIDVGFTENTKHLYVRR